MIGAVDRVGALWHKDGAGMRNPDHLVGKSYVHIKTAGLYVVTGFYFNATTDRWALRYDKADEDKRKEFCFVRDMHEFLDGRFLHVE